MHTLINSCLISSGRCTHLLTLGLAGRGRDGEAAPGAANPPILRITGTNTEKTASRRTGGGSGHLQPSPATSPCRVAAAGGVCSSWDAHLPWGASLRCTPTQADWMLSPPHSSARRPWGSRQPRHHPKTPGSVRGRPPNVAAVPGPAGSCPSEPPSGLHQEPGPVQNAAHVLQRNSSFDRLILPEP